MFYCLHALADGNQCIRIREKTLEFSTVLSTLCPYNLGLGLMSEKSKIQKVVDVAVGFLCM